MVLIKKSRPAKRAIRKVKVKPSLATAVKAIVKSAITRKAETKTAMYYSNSAGFAGDGLYANRSWSGQNQYISNTVTDLKRMLPFVFPGTNENERIGDKITPQSLTVQGTVKITLDKLNHNTELDLFAVIFVLEHVTFKSYTSLIAGNDFTTLLKTGQNTTSAFAGEVWQSQMPVADQYYRLLKKKVVRLRFAGIAPSGAPGATDVSIANSHDYLAKFSLGLSKKHLPVMKYPENPTTTGANDPLNTAPFFAMGYYWADGSTSLVNVVNIEQQYVSCLRYKDM